MFIRIILITVLLAGVAVTGLNLCQLKQKITTLQATLMEQTAGRKKSETELAKTKSALGTTKAALEATIVEEQNALATATAQTRRAGKLGEELATAAGDRDKAQAGLARYRGTGMEPEQIIRAADQIKNLKEELAEAQAKNKTLVANVEKLSRLLPDEGCVRVLPSGFKARVIATDPKWHFVVLDAGENQGVFEYAEILVSRAGKLLGRASVRRVEKERCIANLLLGWEFGEVAEGDVVIPAFPHS